MTESEYSEWEKSYDTYNWKTFYIEHGMQYVPDPNLTDEQNEELEHAVDLSNSLKVLYFAFTSLSTVGFGDMHPKSDMERLLVAAILLIGVAVFSYIMGIFISMLDQHQNLNADFNEGELLSQFFGILRYFNGDAPIKSELKEEIEEFFESKWTKDRGQALSSAEDLKFYDILPEAVQTTIYREFYFGNFLHVFRDTFSIINPQGYNYGWDNQVYRDFMI